MSDSYGFAGLPEGVVGCRESRARMEGSQVMTTPTILGRGSRLVHGTECPAAQTCRDHLPLRGTIAAGFGRWLLTATLVLASASQGSAITILKSFSNDGADGSSPQAPLISDGAGYLYGTTASGGGWGTVFKIKQDGTDFAVLHSFASSPADGARPVGGLTLDANGSLYGTTLAGTIFKLRTDGTGFELLYKFGAGSSGWPPLDGDEPLAGLVLDSAGHLYGTTSIGGTHGGGTVFRVGTDGSDFSVLANLGDDTGQGANPSAGLVLDAAGNLYGTFPKGGAWNHGAVFKVRTDGTGFAVMHDFTGGQDGGSPLASLILDDAGHLYGTTSMGGAYYGGGTVFRLGTDGSGFTTLHSFNYTVIGESDGFAPRASLILDSSGNLYGTVSGGGASAGNGAVFTLRIDGSGFTFLHDFANDGSEGGTPLASLCLDGGGTLVGTTSMAGARGGGTVFSVRTDGTRFFVAHSFGGALQEGARPKAGLALDGETLYGATEYGGAGDTGTEFTLRTDGSGFSVLHSFGNGFYLGANPVAALTLEGPYDIYGATRSGGPMGGGALFWVGGLWPSMHVFAGPPGDGAAPTGSLCADEYGVVYGTTEAGGASNLGTIFVLNPHSSPDGYTLLHNFSGLDGSAPYAGLVRDGAGNLYGTTTAGGAFGLGTVFMMNRDGTGFVVLHSFAGPDGASPYGGLIFADADTLVGTSSAAGPSEDGVVFTIKTNGTGFATLHGFAGGANDGAKPYDALILVGTDTLLGTTSAGGASDDGTIFSIKIDGTAYAIVHSFTGSPLDGAVPYGGLVADRVGNIYGTTVLGGGSDLGTVFSLPVPSTAEQPPAFTSVPTATFVVGTSGTFTVTTTGYPIPGITLGRPLPAGMSFTDNGDGTATLSGTPASGTAGTYSLPLTAHNGSGADSAQLLTLNVVKLRITTPSMLPPARVGFYYSLGFGFSGGSGLATWSVVSGSLPGGLRLDGGWLFGTPTESGDFAFTVRIDDKFSGTAEARFALHVDPELVFSSSAIWIPVVSHGPGLNGSQWRTDVALLNTSAAAANVRYQLFSGGGVVNGATSMGGGDQLILADVVAQLGANGSGAFEILSDQPLRVMSRTYSQSPTGTLGQDYPAYAESLALGVAQSAWLPQLAENSAYRTNIGLTNAGPEPALVAVELHGADGTLMKTYTVGLKPGEWRQVTQPFRTLARQTAMASGYAKVTVTSGSGVFAYGSVVDNTTNDPTTIPMLQADSGSDVWVPVVSHAGGLGGSQWRSDIGLLNTGSMSANVQLKFFAGDRVVTGSASVAAGEQVVLSDVVARLGASGSGALEVLSDQPLKVTSRTYDESSTGTFGQDYGAGSVDQGLGANQSAWLPQLRENDAYRTNIGLTNTGPSPALVTVELRSARDGWVLKKYAVTLGPGEWHQDTEPLKEVAGFSLYEMYAKVTVNSGSGVIAYASLIDNATNDPTTIPMFR